MTPYDQMMVKITSSHCKGKEEKDEGKFLT